MYLGAPLMGKGCTMYSFKAQPKLAHIAKNRNSRNRRPQKPHQLRHSLFSLFVIAETSTLYSDASRAWHLLHKSEERPHYIKKLSSGELAETFAAGGGLVPSL